MGLYVFRDCGGIYLSELEAETGDDGCFEMATDCKFMATVPGFVFPDLKPGECRELVLKPVEEKKPEVVVQVGHSYEMDDGSICDITEDTGSRFPCHGRIRGEKFNTIATTRDGKRRACGIGPYIVRDLGPTNPPKPEPPKPDTVPPVVGHRFKCRGGAEMHITGPHAYGGFFGVVVSVREHPFVVDANGITPFQRELDLIEDLGLYVRAGYTYETRERKHVDITKWPHNKDFPFLGSDNETRTPDGREYLDCDSLLDLIREIGPTPSKPVEYRPWQTMEEVPPNGTWVQHKTGDARVIVGAYVCRDEGLHVLTSWPEDKGTPSTKWRAKQAFQNFVHLDNSPCGVKVEG